MTDESRSTKPRSPSPSRTTAAKTAPPSGAGPRPAAAVTTPPPRPAVVPLRLRDLALAGVAIAAAIDPASIAPKDRALEPGFLARLRAEVEDTGKTWIQTVSETLRQPATADLPLLALGREMELTIFEVLVIALATAVEEDTLVGRALAHVQSPVGGSRPTVGLLSAALSDCLATDTSALALLLMGEAARSGLLVLLNESAPLPERPVMVPTPLCLALAGHDALHPGTTLGLGSIPSIPLPPSVLHEAARNAQALLARPDGGLILRSGSPIEGRNVAAEIARLLRRRPLFIETDRLLGLGPLVRLRQWLPVFCFDLGPGERRTVPTLPGYRGPFLAVTGPDGGLESSQGPLPGWSVPVVPQEERQALWEAALGPGDTARELAQAHRHGIGRIASLGRLAQHFAVLSDRTQPTQADVTAAACSGDGTGLESLAEPLRTVVPDEALVLTPALRAELEGFLQRCRLRDSLAAPLGASAATRYRPGVRALFLGPSGTGKTLAAGWLATRLGMPLYRVDLANVTSKYIGETEKNLAQLLARAEQAEVILLFDEADSLFGKRTDVRDANDRFANAQTNYLLQRIEQYDGITILTSNNKARFDSGFARRLDLVVHFDLPAPQERRALWLSHLGSHHTLTDPELNRLAAHVDLGGGHIRMVVLAAAVTAQTHQRKVSLADILQAVDGEYRKLGRPLPMGLKD